jgi:hypothetical protein
MKKQLSTIVGITVLLLSICLSGCNNKSINPFSSASFQINSYEIVEKGGYDNLLLHFKVEPPCDTSYYVIDPDGHLLSEYGGCSGHATNVESAVYVFVQYMWVGETYKFIVQKGSEYSSAGEILYSKKMIFNADNSITFNDWSVPTSPTFELSSWDVAASESGSWLSLRFNTAINLEFKLVDPNGFLVDTTTANRYENSAEIKLVDTNGAYTPQPGEYKLIVNDNLFTKNIVFNGGELTILDCSLGWEYFGYQYYEITSITMAIRNSGDLPVFFNGINIKVGNQKYDYTFKESNLFTYTTLTYFVLPGKERSITSNIIASYGDQIKVVPGAYDVTITLNYLNTNASYSRNMAPGEDVQFTLNSWNLYDDGGTPSIFIRFDVSDEVLAHLLNPDGIEIDYKTITPNENTVILHMALSHESPGPGTYKLIAGKFIKELTFYGSYLTISSCNVEWDDFGGNQYRLGKVILRGKNNGDLPISVKSMDVTLGDKSGEGDVKNQSQYYPVIMPNQEMDIICERFVNYDYFFDSYFLPSEPISMTVVLKTIKMVSYGVVKDEILKSYSTTVTPQ